MKLKNLLFLFIAAAGLTFAATGCNDEEADFSYPSLKLSSTAGENVTSLLLEKDPAKQTLMLLSSRDWKASCESGWVSITPESGKASDEPQEIILEVLGNESYDRTTIVRFDMGFDYKSLEIKQVGPGGDYVEPIMTVAEFIQLGDKANMHRLSGVVSNYNATYGSFDLTDAAVITSSLPPSSSMRSSRPSSRVSRTDRPRRPWKPLSRRSSTPLMQQSSIA